MLARERQEWGAISLVTSMFDVLKGKGRRQNKTRSYTEDCAQSSSTTESQGICR